MGLGQRVIVPVMRRGAVLSERLLRHPDIAVVNLLWGRIGDVDRYAGYLNRIVPRFKQANARYLERRIEAERLSAAEREKAATPEGQGRDLTPAEEAILSELRGLIDGVHLEIETFYVFAKILLDRVAELLGIAFELKPFKRLGSTHAQLATRLRAGVVGIDITQLAARIEALEKVVVNYRSDYVEHVPDFHQQRGTIYSQTEVKIRTSRSGGSVAVESENPTKLLGEIDDYIGAVIRFIEANPEKTILKTRPEGKR